MAGRPRKDVITPEDLDVSTMETLMGAVKDIIEESKEKEAPKTDNYIVQAIVKKEHISDFIMNYYVGHHIEIDANRPEDALIKIYEH